MSKEINYKAVKLNFCNGCDWGIDVTAGNAIPDSVPQSFYSDEILLINFYAHLENSHCTH